MQKNPTALFSNSIVGPTKSNLANQAQIFLVFGDCKIGFHFDLFRFGSKMITWTVKNKAVCLCGICLTWLKETRYKGTYSLNSFCTVRSSLKLERNSYGVFFVNYDLNVSRERRACVCLCVCLCRCVFCSHICFYILLFSPRSLLPDLGLYRAGLRLERKDKNSGEAREH